MHGHCRLPALREIIQAVPLAADMVWIPTPFNLLDGNPFEYSDHAISSISGTEAFETGIKARDSNLCIVCGHSERRNLNYVHKIPKFDEDIVRCALQFYCISN